MSLGVALSGFLASTDLYKRFTEEREQILRNKWYMSEKAGHDVGFEKALMDWVIRHRDAWVESVRKNLS